MAVGAGFAPGSSGGVTMDETSPISDYNVEDGDEVLLIPSSTAG